MKLGEEGNTTDAIHNVCYALSSSSASHTICTI